VSTFTLNPAPRLFYRLIGFVGGSTAVVFSLRLAPEEDEDGCAEFLLKSKFVPPSLIDSFFKLTLLWPPLYVSFKA